MALRGLGCVADHRPGRAWRFISLTQAPISRMDSSGEMTALEKPRIGPRRQARPFWLLKRLIRLPSTPIRLLAGPERIESGWWDDGDKERDYYVIETHLGQRGWAFVPANSASGWMLHGWFA
jgi:protein ImuB